MQTDIVPILGIHTSGKSTLIQAIKKMDFSTLGEIAQEMIDEGTKLGIYSCEENQRIIMQREYQRDVQVQELLRTENKPVYIESWHIGNLAHCKALGLPLFDQYLETFKRIKDQYTIDAVFLNLDPNEIRYRSKIETPENMNQAIDFHRKVGEETIEILQNLDIPYHYINSDQMLKEIKLIL